MANIRVKINKDAIEQAENLDSVARLIGDAAQKIADACNGESSWGGYDSVNDSGEAGIGSRAAVIDYAEPSTDTRWHRLIANLDAARL